jgi:L-serine dehydratase
VFTRVIVAQTGARVNPGHAWVNLPCPSVSSKGDRIPCRSGPLADYDPVIPLDAVIETARQVSGQMPRELRRTGLGGLAATQTSVALERQLAARKTGDCGSGCAPFGTPPTAMTRW